jgi:site-specific recombinase XerD
MMSRSPPPDVSGAVDWYLTVQCKADGLSAATINEGYGYPLRRILVPFCEQEGIELVEELNPDVVTRLAAQLAERRTAQGKPLSPASRRSYLKGVQQFLSWAEKRGFGSVDASEMPLPRRRRIRRAVLTRQEMLALEDAAPTERNKLIIRLMSDTGTREGGVCAIRCGGLVVKEGRYCYVMVRDKTSQERPVPVEPALFRRLKAHAEGKSGRPRGRPEEPLFVQSRKVDGRYEPLQERGVYKIIKDAAARAGIDRRIYPHLLKHSAITWMTAVKRMDPGVVSEITGTSIAVIAEYYSHPTQEQQFEALMRALRGDD